MLPNKFFMFHVYAVILHRVTCGQVALKCPHLPSDAIYGPGNNPIGHMFFRWLKDPEGKVIAGHFDLLQPWGPGQGQTILLPKVAPLHFQEFANPSSLQDKCFF